MTKTSIVQGVRLKELLETTESELIKFKKWFDIKLSLNKGRTKFMVFSGGRGNWNKTVFKGVETETVYEVMMLLD